MTDIQHDRVAELVILLKLDEIMKKKIPAPSKEVLDKLQKVAMDEFAAYQGRIKKVPEKRRYSLVQLVQLPTWCSRQWRRFRVRRSRAGVDLAKRLNHPEEFMEIVAILVSLLLMPYFSSREFWSAAMDYAQSSIQWVLANSMLSSIVALGLIATIIICSVVSRRPMLVDLNLDKQ